MMVPLKSKLALMSVVASVSGALLAGLAGCDAVESGEAQASRKVAAATAEATRSLGMGNADAAHQALPNVDAAAGSAAKAQAYAILAETDYSRAQPLLAELDASQVKAATLAWEIDQLITRLQAAATTAQTLQQRDPQTVRAEAAKAIKSIQGDANAATWVDDADGEGDVPTLTAVTQRISQLEGEIAKRREKISQLAEQRKKLGAEAQALIDKANQTPGQAGVDTFRNATQVRQQANALGIQIDGVNAELIPLNNDLAVAQAQREVLQRAVTRIQDIDKTQAEGWQQVGQQMDGQNQLAQQILRAVGGAGGVDASDSQASIEAKLGALKALIAESGDIREQANQYLSEAAKNAASAAQQAQALGTAVLAKGRVQSQSKPAFDAMQKANDPNAYRLQELDIRQTLASSLAHRASMIALAVDTQNRLQSLAQATKLTLPTGLVDAQLATDLTEARAAATEAFQQAVELSQTIKDAGGASTDQRNAARVAGVITRYAWATAARAAGDTATADAQLANARAEVSEAAADNATFPALPAELNVPRRNVASEAPAAPANQFSPQPEPETPGFAPTEPRDGSGFMTPVDQVEP